MKHKDDGDIRYSGCAWNGSQRLDKEAKKLEIEGQAEIIVVKIGRVTVKRLRDLGTLAVTQTLVNDH